MEDARSNLKEDFFKYIATWESVVTGHIIDDKEKDLGFSRLYQSSKATMEDLMDAHNYQFDLSLLVPHNRDPQVQKMWLEFLGNTKHFGHPCLNLTAGFEKVKEIGTEAVFVDQNTADTAAAIFVRDFIKEFIAKKRRWPLCKSIPTQFKEYYETGRYPLHLSNDYNIWFQIVFDKNFEYDYSPDTTELLKDSSCSEEFKYCSSSYDSCAFQQYHGVQKPYVNRNKKSTRVIDIFLTGDEFELRQKIYELEHDYYDPQDLIAVLCRKEQELKPEGRMFVKQTYRQRLVQTSMENNVAKQIMRYVPEQTMTNGEIQLMRRLADTAKDQNQNVEIYNLDLSKWNMRFRHALVNSLGKFFDQLFGFKRLFANNHLWFIMSTVLCNSRLAPPKPMYHTGKVTLNILKI